MPKSMINKHQYKTGNIGAWVVSQLFKKKLKRKDLAEALDITRQGLNWKLHQNSFDYSDLLIIFDFLGSSDEEIVRAMKY